MMDLIALGFLMLMGIVVVLIARKGQGYARITSSIEPTQLAPNEFVVEVSFEEKGIRLRPRGRTDCDVVAWNLLNEILAAGALNLAPEVRAELRELKSQLISKVATK